MKSLPDFRFSLGPWCLDVGRDSFGPPVREEYSLEEVLRTCSELGYDGIELHDDDVVPDLNQLSHSEINKKATEVRKQIEHYGLNTVFIAPRLWEDEHTIDGAVTSNNPGDRQYALDRSKKAIDIANILGTINIVFFFGREGTYIREAKESKRALTLIIEYLNQLLEYDKNIKILGETKPNEPMDLTFCPTAGHFIGISYKTEDPSRVGVCIESAHCIMIGLDPADEFGYALWHNKLWGVHLDDQNGQKYNQHRTFGAINLRQAFNQVMVLASNGYGLNGEFVGIETRSLRTQSKQKAKVHLKNSKQLFLRLVDISRDINTESIKELRDNRDYESLEMYILDKLVGLDYQG